MTIKHLLFYSIIVLFSCQKRTDDCKFKLFLNQHIVVLIQEYCDSVIHLEDLTSPYMFFMTAEVHQSDTLFSICTVPYPTRIVEEDQNVKQYYAKYRDTLFLLAAFSVDLSSNISIKNRDSKMIKQKLKEDTDFAFSSDNLKRGHYQSFMLVDGILIPIERRDYDDVIYNSELELSDDLFDDSW